jgi:hypothetical protein
MGECKSTHYSTRENSIVARLEDSTPTVSRRRLLSDFEHSERDALVRYRPYDWIG